MNHNTIEISNLSFGYYQKPVLQNFSLTLQGGKLISVLGANGAGKSTLFRLILGLLKPWAGQIMINGVLLHNAKPSWLAKQMAYIPQSQSIAIDYSALEMVLLGKTASVALFHTPKPEDAVSALDALNTVGIEHLAHSPFNELSGGERQLVLIARAICQNSPIMVMDEPCSSLDYGNQIRILQTIKGLADRGYLILLSTHTPEHAQLFADEVLILADGKVLAQDMPSVAMSEQNLSYIYNLPLKLIQTTDGSAPTIRPL